jgi:hypothetical protein
MDLLTKLPQNFHQAKEKGEDCKNKSDTVIKKIGEFYLNHPYLFKSEHKFLVTTVKSLRNEIDIINSIDNRVINAFLNTEAESESKESVFKLTAFAMAYPSFVDEFCEKIDKFETGIDDLEENHDGMTYAHIQYRLEEFCGQKCEYLASLVE